MVLPNEKMSTLLYNIRCQLACAGLSPLSINWGPWWEEDYYAV